MAAQSDPDKDSVTFCADETEGGTLVRVVAPSRQIRMADLMPVFEALDLNLVSYTAERDPDAVGNGALQAPLGRRKHGFRGRFLVTDADGHNLSDAMLDGLVAALQEALHVRLRTGRCSAMQEESRRGSVASCATEPSADPDSPSSVVAAAAAAASGSLHGHASGGSLSQGSYTPSNLNPGHQQQQQQGYGVHQHLQPNQQQQQLLDPHQQQQQLQQLQNHQQQQHHVLPYQCPPPHDHAPSAGSMLFSEHSVSSVSSLLRAPSGAASDPPAVPSPPSNTRLDNSTFAFLQQQVESAFLDAANQGLISAAAAAAASSAMMAAANGFPCDERYGGGAPTTPFGAAAAAGSYQQYHHHQHTRSQPVPQPQLHAVDMYELGLALPQRASSASSTTPSHVSGTLPTIHAAILPEAAPPPLAATATSGRSSGAHVSFLEPLACAVTTTATGAAITPVNSRPPSGASVAPIPGSPLPLASTGSSTRGMSGEMQAEASMASGASASAASGSAAGGSYTVHAVQPLPPRTSGEDGNPRSGSGSSDEEREGSYTWWSTFSAQDTVARIMSHPARSISADADLGQAKSLMTKHNISALLVNTGSASPGFITKRDFLKVQFSKTFKRTKVKDVMTQPVIFVDINLPIEQCSRVLEAHGVRRVLVYDPSRATGDDPLSAFVGVVSDADLFKCMGAPAMSPVIGSMANSSEQAHPNFSMLPGTALPPLPSLPPLCMPSAAEDPTSPPQQWQQQPQLHHSASQPQPHPLAQQQQQQPHQAQSQPLPVPLSSVASSASASVAGSVGPSHAASITTGGMAPSSDAVTSTAGTGTGALGMSGCTASAVAMRLHAEASLAERYRCAAALWELDFTELEVTRRIGEGSFGEVLLANFRGTKVAVKRLRGFDVGPDNPDTGGPGEPGPSPTQMPIFRQFFEREIEILATIRHPNVVNFIGACHTPPNVCLVTEYCARGSLDHLLHKSSIPLDLLKKVEFSMDIARGMSCLHSQKPPIIHRDLKTANLLVSARFEVKVADFGLSRIKDHAQLINSRAGLEGTVEYAAPEVLRGEPYTEKCDIWSYAVLLWEIIHRQRPYADADVPIYILMMSLGNGTLRLPPVREEQATSGLARLVERCMSWHPAERPSFREVLHALEAEYKILRGKAAAVPRSDSASSMMVLPGSQNRGPGADGGAQHDAHHPHGAAAAAGAPSPAPGPSGAAGAAAAVGRPAPQTPQQQRIVSGPQRKSSKLGFSPHSPGPEPGGARGGAEAAEAGPNGVQHSQHPATDPHLHAHPQPQNQQQSSQQPRRPRVKLAVPAQAAGPFHNSLTTGGTGGHQEGPDPVSPADSSSRPASSRNAGASAAGRGGPGGGGAAKPGSAGRPTGRSLRSAARSKSMPLPEFEWFGGEEGSDEYMMDTTDSIADDDADAGASAGTSVSGVAPGAGAPAAAPQHPHSLLSPDRGGVRSTPYPCDTDALRPGNSVDDALRDTVDVAADDAAAAAGASSPPLPHHLMVRVARPSEEAQDPAVPAAGSRVPPEGGQPAAWGGRPADSTSFSPLVTAAVARQSPFQMAASSPFADAADMPWSPRGSDEAGSSPSCFGSHSMSESAAQLQQLHLQHQQVLLSAKPAAAAAVAAAAPTATPPPPRRAAFVSPFAQLANDAPPSPPRGTDYEEEEERRVEAATAMDEESKEEGQRWRRPAASSGGAGGNAAAAAPASTANSADVNVAVEKDQQTPVEACWSVLGSCSKPPSGDVYPPGAAAVRMSPPTSNQPGLSSPYAQRGVDAVDAGAGAVPLAAGQAEGAPQQGVVLVMEEEEDGSEREPRLVAAMSSASAELSLALPGVMAFGGPSMADVRSDSGQFDEDEDATLHTTAWVRL
ncbi:hypothetical protein PLESTB_000360900 [Pleodorina starrii]|uniref:Protein kinase domain-containing protein n=1 Tax=Pleodorina starrii TaxID=330485 RepID=A0A9W6BDV3_9CHLO|nr:hypothetical protein PLESTM_000034300 [Pleodorina starrii]GLC50269.1 hypothetical protein PLESTB_000360900 [Pleodorina starrii]GLC64347.1 hypothetical protein PLESTF_000151700 [Pleodorina starrii]